MTSTMRPSRLARVESLALVAATLLVSPALRAQSTGAPPRPAPISAPTRSTSPGGGFSPERLARIDRYFTAAVDSNRIAGAVALVLRDGAVVYEKAFGFADRESGKRMTVDAIFRIASQSKAITSATILALVEEGKLAPGDPVSRWLPSFARTRVATRVDTGVQTAPARRAITLADLLTHTAGISYGTDPHVASLYAAQGLGPATGFGYYTADKNEPICTTMDRLGTLPFVRQPGDAWVYGYNTDILGCVAERASGTPLDALIRERITGPLRMDDTFFFVPPEKRARLVTVYASDSLNRAVRAPEGQRGQGHYADGPRRSFAGGAGLLSTANDYATFLEALRRGGAVGSARILAPHTVRLMTTNQIGTIRSSTGLGHGFGFGTVDRYGANGMMSVGSFEWGGAYGSVGFVDPVERIVAVLMLNQIPNRSEANTKFATLVYQALVDVDPRGGN